MLKRLQRHAGLVNFAIHPPHLTKLCLVNLKCGNFEVGDPEYGEARNPDYGEARNMTTVRLVTPRALRVRGRLRSLAEAVASGSYLRLIDSCITQLKAQGPSRTCNESKEEEEEEAVASNTRSVFQDWMSGEGILL